MKKIAFMFVAAAMFAACGGNKETKVEEQPQVVTPDTAAVTKVVMDAFESYTLTADDSIALGVEPGTEVALDSAKVADFIKAKIDTAIEEALKAKFEELNPTPAEDAPQQ